MCFSCNHIPIPSTRTHTLRFFSDLPLLPFFTLQAANNVFTPAHATPELADPLRSSPSFSTPCLVQTVSQPLQCESCVLNQRELIKHIPAVTLVFRVTTRPTRSAVGPRVFFGQNRIRYTPQNSLPPTSGSYQRSVSKGTARLPLRRNGVCQRYCTRHRLLSDAEKAAPLTPLFTLPVLALSNS